MIKYNGVQYDESEIRGNPPPAIGSDIYVGTSVYLSHGVDDFCGGKCRVSRVSVMTSAGRPAWFVSVEERPATSYSWEFLREKQEELRAMFGEARGHADPDNDPESNRW